MSFVRRITRVRVAQSGLSELIFGCCRFRRSVFLLSLPELLKAGESAATTTTTEMSRHPFTKWAQRSDKVYITIELPDAKDVKLSLQPDGRFSFSAIAGADNLSYALELELFDNVTVDESKSALGQRHIVYVVKKAESKWWARLLKQGGKSPSFLKVDWDKWVEEDEENKFGGDTDFGDMDFSGLDAGAAEDEAETSNKYRDDEEDVADEAGDEEMEDAKEAAAAEAAAPAATGEPDVGAHA